MFLDLEHWRSLQPSAVWKQKNQAICLYYATTPILTNKTTCFILSALSVIVTCMKSYVLHTNVRSKKRKKATKTPICPDSTM